MAWGSLLGPGNLLAPGHRLLDAVADALLERYRELLRRGCVLVDYSDDENEARVLFSIESEITDGRSTREGNRRIVPSRIEYAKWGEDGQLVLAGAAPYLDYRVATDSEAQAAVGLAGWVSPSLEDTVNGFAIEHISRQHH